MGSVRNLKLAAGSVSVIKKVEFFLGAVRFQETIFALPFAYSGMVLAADGFPVWDQFFWITVAMVSARTLGMSANRVIDRHIDARNPRTAMRHLPAGLLRVADMTVLSLVSLGIFLFAAAMLNSLALVLAPIAAVYLIIYPFTKRFTWLANLFLGWALAIAPFGAWIGVRGSLDWEPLLLSFAVAMWAGSSDILYHIQDTEYYIAHGLHSVAQRFGVVASFRWALVLDVIAAVCLVVLGLWMGLSYPYFIGCIVVTMFLLYKYRMVSPSDTSSLGLAFFRINAYVSTTVFLSTLAAILVD